MVRCTWTRHAALAVTLIFSPALAADKVTFATNWLPEAEHGGYYQALADGTYARFGLDVTILPGGPQTGNRLLLAAGKIEFYMGVNMIQPFNAVEQKVPTIVIAAHFQKDPEIIMSHPGTGHDNWNDLTSAKAFIGKESLASFYQWMVIDHGFKEENVAPYNFNPGPFIADKNAIQGGYVTSEPFEVERVGKFKPNVFLLADLGFTTYATLVEARTDLVEKNPDLVQRFVDASAIGWYTYLYGDSSKGNAAIKLENPDISDEQIAFSTAEMRRYGIVDSGDSLKLGIGAMTDARMKDFFDKMVKAKVVAPGIDYKKAYTLQFVNKGVGLDLRPKN